MRTASHLITLLALAMIAFASGCSSSGVQRQDTATAGLEQVRANLATGSEQIDSMGTAIRNLQSTEDLDTAYRAFTTELGRLKKQSEKVRARRAAMESRLDDHIAKWQDDLASIQNETARELTTQRATQIKIAAGRVQNALNDAKDAYDPYISNLLDIELILANDLSVRGIKAIEETLVETIELGQTLKARLADASVAVGQVRGEFNR